MYNFNLNAFFWENEANYNGKNEIGHEKSNIQWLLKNIQIQAILAPLVYARIGFYCLLFATITR